MKQLKKWEHLFIYFAQGKENLINQVKINVDQIAQMNYSWPKHWMKIERNQYFSTHDSYGDETPFSNAWKSIHPTNNLKPNSCVASIKQ